MMTCKTVRARLAALLDGELTPTMTAKLETHLAECVECAHERAAIVATLDAANAWQLPEDDVWEAVKQQIEIPASQVSAQSLRLPELGLILSELRTLREEVRTLRAEVAALRQPLSSRPTEPARKPSVLLPYESVGAMNVRLM